MRSVGTAVAAAMVDSSGRRNTWQYVAVNKRKRNSDRAERAPVLRRPAESGQYRALRYTDRLAEAGIKPSVGSVGDNYDNALAETINGLFKAEMIYRNVSRLYR